MDKIIVLPIIFLVLLLTMGIVLSTNEIISKNTTADNVAQTHNDSLSVDIEDTNKILRGNFIDSKISNDFENVYLDYEHDVLIN